MRSFGLKIQIYSLGLQLRRKRGQGTGDGNKGSFGGVVGAVNMRQMRERKREALGIPIESLPWS